MCNLSVNRSGFDNTLKTPVNNPNTPPLADKPKKAPETDGIILPRETDDISRQLSGKAEAVVGLDMDDNDLTVEITDKDGLNKDSKNDIEISVNGKVDISKEVTLESKDVDPEKIKINASKDKKTVSLTYDVDIPFLGKSTKELLALKMENKNGELNIVLDPSVILTTFTDVFKDEKSVNKAFGLPEGTVKSDKDTGTFYIPAMELLKSKFPDGIPAGGKKIKLNEIDAKGLTFDTVAMKNGKIDLALGFKDVKITGGTGKGETKADKSSEQKIIINLDINKIDPDKGVMESFNKGDISLSNVSTAVEKALEDGGLSNVKVQFKNNELHIEGTAALGLVKAKIPVTVDGTKINIDFSKATGMNFINELITENLSRNIYDSTSDHGKEGITSKIEGTKLVIDINEAIPQDMKAKFDKISIRDDGTVKLEFSKGTADLSARVGNKVSMINNLFDGYTSGTDEQAIKNILANSDPQELSQVLDKISLKRLEDELDDSDYAKVMQHLARNHTVGNNAKHLNTMIKLGDDDTARGLLRGLNDRQVAALPPEIKQNLFNELANGSTSGEEEKMLKKLIMTSSPNDLSAMLAKISIKRLESELDDKDLADILEKLADNHRVGNNAQHFKNLMSRVDDDTTMHLLRKMDDKQLKDLAANHAGKEALNTAWKNLDSGWTNSSEETQMKRIKRVIS